MLRRIMNILQKIDGNKTYILAIIGGLLGIVHFMVVGDYSVSSFITLSQDSGFCAMIAALRHGIAKAGNQGTVTTGGTK